MIQLKELKEQFVEAMHQAETIRAPYEGKSENMTAEEEERYDKFLSEADGLKSQIERLEKSDKLVKWAKEIPDRMKHGTGRTDPNVPDEVKRLDDLKRKAYSRYLRGISKQDDPVKYYEHTKEYRDYVEAASTAAPEVKAYQADNPTGGGFMVMPQQLVAEVLTLMKDLVFMRQLATLFEVTTAESLGVPAIDTDPSDSDWTVELGTGSEESTLAFGKRELRPNPLAKLIKLSKKLLRQVVDADSVILDRLTYKGGITEEKAFLTGTGANQPLGVFTPSASGISTSRDTTAASTTAFTADELITTLYALKAQYRAKASWILNRTVVAAARKLKDTANNYLWQPGLNGFVAVGTGLIGATPETLLSRPIYESEYAPGTLTAALYVAIVGDFSRYWIADALDMQIQVLYELYAATNQMGYILRKETDGMPVLEEAFSRLILHA